MIGTLIIKYRDGRTVEVRTDGKWEAATTVQGKWQDRCAGGRWPGSRRWSWERWAWRLGEMWIIPPGRSKALYPSADAIAGLMKKLGVPPDFDYVTQSSERSLRYIHKRIGKTDLFFVANEKPHPEQAVCSFRVQGKRPELWWPDSGRIERAAVYDEVDGCVRMPIRFDASGSVFVMFRPGERHRARTGSQR